MPIWSFTVAGAVLPHRISLGTPWQLRRYVTAYCHDEDAKCCCSHRWSVSLYFGAFSGFPSKNDCSLLVLVVQYPSISSHFVRNVSLMSVQSDLWPRRPLCPPGTSSARVNNIWGHNIIVISYPQQSNGLGARFFFIFFYCITKLYCVTLVLERWHLDIPTSQ